MQSFDSILNSYFGYGILITGTLFTLFWMLDYITHKAIYETDITDKELQTHRNILLASVLMEASLVTMYWFPWQSLPFFIAFFLTRSAHEFIDEIKYHAGRCTPYESMLHLGMWVSVLSQTVLIFLWGFFKQYDGIWEMGTGWFVWGIALFLIMSFIGIREWQLGHSNSSGNVE